jgi:hypothetical protein
MADFILLKICSLTQIIHTASRANLQCEIRGIPKEMMSPTDNPGVNFYIVLHSRFWAQPCKLSDRLRHRRGLLHQQSSESSSGFKRSIRSG